MLLADILSRHRAEIVERFAHAMRDSGLGEDTPRSQLIAHVSFFLADLEEALRDGTDGDANPSSTTARVHGHDRYGAGFDLAGLVREYGLLRRAIVSVASDAGVTPDARELDVIATSIDVALAEAASGYSARRDAELIAERDALADAVRFREDVVAIVSHDLRSPLTAITLTVRQLGRIDVAAEMKGKHGELLAQVQRSCERMTRLIADLLDAATIEAGTLKVEPAPVEAAALIADALDSVRPLAEQKSIRIATREAVDGAQVLADRDRILQVLANLLGNAVKFTPERGQIDVDCTLQHDELRVSVRDTGPGIPRELLGKVFDRYYKGSGGRGGAGLGLAIAKGIVEAHERHIHVESEEGRGATFWFTLPLVTASQGAVADDRARPRASRG